MRLKTLLPFAALIGLQICAAQTYPDRPVTLVVSSTAGGGLDAVSRALADELKKRLGQPIIVDNKGGAGGMVAAQSVAKARPDGYTILVTHGTPLVSAPLMYKSVPYDVRKDFAFVTMFGVGPLVLAVNQAVPAKTVKEFVDWSRANKGKVNYGSLGIGSVGHLASSFMSRSLELDMAHAPYKGEAQLVQDMIGGQVSWGFATMGTLAPHLASGRVHALAVLGDRRLSGLPNVPTMTEAGYADPEYKVTGWIGVLAPAGTPAPVLEQLEKAAREAVCSPAVTARLQSYGWEPVGNSSAEFRRGFEDSIPVIARLVREAGIVPE